MYKENKSNIPQTVPFIDSYVFVDCIGILTCCTYEASASYNLHAKCNQVSRLMVVAKYSRLINRGVWGDAVQILTVIPIIL